MLKQFVGFLILILTAAACNDNPPPQKPDAVRRKSPIAIANVTDQTTHTFVKIVYGQPY